MVERMGRIVDRTDEHLGTTDVAVITARGGWSRMARELQEGVRPYAAHHGELIRVRSAVTTSPGARTSTGCSQASRTRSSRP